MIEFHFYGYHLSKYLFIRNFILTIASIINFASLIHQFLCLSIKFLSRKLLNYFSNSNQSKMVFIFFIHLLFLKFHFLKKVH